jgi:hypothetical protein
MSPARQQGAFGRAETAQAMISSEESEGELVEVARTTPAETKKSEPGERTEFEHHELGGHELGGSRRQGSRTVR